MRKQFFELTGTLIRKALEDVREIAIRIVSIELCGLDQAHHGGSALPGAQGSGEEPVVSAERHGADPVFNMIVVDRQIAIFDVASECCPATQAVVDCFARRRTVWYLVTLSSEPLAQSFRNGF